MLWGEAEQLATNRGVSIADGEGRQPVSAERVVLIGFGDIYRAAVANPEEARALVGLTGGSMGASVGGLGLGCGPAAPACVAGGVVAGFGIGYWTSSSIVDYVADPRQYEPAYMLSSWLYAGLLGQDFTP